MPDALYHVVCHACPFEGLTSKRENADLGVRAHRKRTGHDVEHMPIDGTVECDECHTEVPVEFLKENLVHALGGRRPQICLACWRAGGLW